MDKEKAEGHLAHVINEVVNELDLSELYARYSALGCTACPTADDD